MELGLTARLSVNVLTIYIRHDPEVRWMKNKMTRYLFEISKLRGFGPKTHCNKAVWTKLYEHARRTSIVVMAIGSKTCS